MTSKYLKFPPFYFFCLYSITFIFFTFCFNYILLDDALFYKSFGETLGVDRIAQVISQQRFFQKIGYGIIPFVLLLRAFYTAICLFIGIFVLEKKVKFNQCFNIAIKADIVFLIELIIKINYFSFLGVNSLQELNTHLFSALQWVGANNIEQWLSYPLGILNIFEVIYWILLALFLSHFTKESFGSSFGFVAKTYGIGLLLWVVFIMFLVLNFL